MTPAQKTMMREFNQEYFALLEKYWNPNTSDVYWDELTDAAMSLLDRFQTHDRVLSDFISNIVAAFLNSREEMLA